MRAETRRETCPEPPKADKDLEAMIEAYVAEKEQIQRAVYEEAGVTGWSSGHLPLRV